jgi:hypothetical protein
MLDQDTESRGLPNPDYPLTEGQTRLFHRATAALVTQQALAEHILHPTDTTVTGQPFPHLNSQSIQEFRHQHPDLEQLVRSGCAYAAAATAVNFLQDWHTASSELAFDPTLTANLFLSTLADQHRPARDGRTRQPLPQGLLIVDPEGNAYHHALALAFNHTRRFTGLTAQTLAAFPDLSTLLPHLKPGTAFLISVNNRLISYAQRMLNQPETTEFTPGTHIVPFMAQESGQILIADPYAPPGQKPLVYWEQPAVIQPYLSTPHRGLILTQNPASLESLTQYTPPLPILTPEIKSI